MSINQVKLAEAFAALVEVDNPSYGEREMAMVLTDRLQNLGLTVEEDNAWELLGGNAGNLYAYLPGYADAKPLLFSCHMDSVEPSKGKRAVVGEDGVIRSAGDTVLGADDLSGVAAILEALRVIKEKNLPHRPVELLFSVAEEVYGKGAELFDYSKIKSREAYTLDLTGPVGSAANKAPTILSFEANIAGKASHAGFAPEQGSHAILAAASAISRLPMGRIDADSTFNIGVMQGGEATNIVPERCTVKGEVRSYSHEKAIALCEKARVAFEEAAGEVGASVDFSYSVGVTAYETPIDHPVVERFHGVCDSLGLPFSIAPTFGGSDNNHFAQNGIAGIVLASAMHDCHSTKETTSVEEMAQVAQIVLELIASTK